MIKILTVGKVKRKSMKEEINFFINRIKKFTKIKMESAEEAKYKNSLDVVKDESNRLIKMLAEKDYSICLDRKGKSIDSIELAKKVNDIISHGKVPTFIIGGAYGTSETLANESNLILSISKFTLQHDIALLVMLEQLYRVFTIINNHPYHK